ncbi:unnamed protein product [Camellia sinensis]
MWVVVVVVAAAVVEVCWCWGEEARQRNTAEMTIFTEDAIFTEDGEEDKADCWADWETGELSAENIPRKMQNAIEGRCCNCFRRGEWEVGDGIGF